MEGRLLSGCRGEAGGSEQSPGTGAMREEYGEETHLILLTGWQGHGREGNSRAL